MNNVKHFIFLQSILLIKEEMGHSYWDSFENTSQFNLNQLLHNALQRTNLASMNHLEDVIDNGRFRQIPLTRNMLQWVDQRNEVISISFPAILNKEGNFSCIPPNFVSHLNFMGKIIELKKNGKVSNSLFERQANTIFQLSQLKETYKYEISTEAIDCCMSAIHILNEIYRKAERIIRSSEYYLIFFHI